MKLSIDYETRSLAELKDVGGWAYSQHPSTEVLCCGVSINDGPATCYDMRTDRATVVLLLQEADEIHAWNAAFEYAITINVLKLNIADEKFFDTTALACAASFPAALGKCGDALNLSVKKSADGERLIKLFSLPATAGKLKGQFRNPEDHEEDFKAFMDYCRQDVEAEKAIAAALPPLSDDEREFWNTTWRTNIRGVPMDTELIIGLMDIVEKGQQIIGAAVYEQTQGALDGDSVKNNHKKTAAYLELPSVAKPYVKELLANGLLDAKTRSILEARQALGRTAVAKLPKFREYMGTDERVRFVHRFNGAQSGRDTSLGCNFMNLPRGAKFDVPRLVTAAKAKNWQDFFEASKFLVGKKGPEPCPFDPLGAVVACLRGCLAPKSGVFMQCDYASIEPRMLAWYSGQEWELEAWRKYDAGEGPDLYRVFAAAAWNIDVKDVSGDQRQMGKVGKLACFPASTEILTEDGYKPIVEITARDRVWDGDAFVTTDGPVYQGERECLNLCGLQTTPDHKILVGGKWRSAEAVSEAACFLQSVLNSQTTRFLGTRGVPGGLWYTCGVSAALNITLKLVIFGTIVQGVVKRAALRHASLGIKKKHEQAEFVQTLRIAVDYSVALPLRTLAAITRIAANTLTTVVGE